MMFENIFGLHSSELVRNAFLSKSNSRDDISKWLGIRDANFSDLLKSVLGNSEVFRLFPLISDR